MLSSHLSHGPLRLDNMPLLRENVEGGHGQFSVDLDLLKEGFGLLSSPGLHGTGAGQDLIPPEANGYRGH